MDLGSVTVSSYTLGGAIAGGPERRYFSRAPRTLRWSASIRRLLSMTRKAGKLERLRSDRVYVAEKEFDLISRDT